MRLADLYSCAGLGADGYAAVLGEKVHAAAHALGRLEGAINAHTTGITLSTGEVLRTSDKAFTADVERIVRDLAASLGLHSHDEA